MNKPTIYIFADWYAPGYKAGGPIQSVVNLAQLLSNENNVKVITRNTDYGSIMPYPNLENNTWINISGVEVLYLSKENTTFKSIKDLCKLSKHDIVIINGLFSFWYSVLPLFLANIYNRKKILVAVRGMLHKSALSVKPTKKMMFLAFARGFGLYKKSVLLASTLLEKKEIESSLGKVKIEIVPNIPIAPISFHEIESKEFKPNGILRLLFLGRISAEKNPLSVLKALQEINIPIHIHFVGDGIDKNYLQNFENTINQLPKNITLKHTKELPHHKIQFLFLETDIMILPSLGENFGHAIFESIANATPVIIGNNTPWKGIEDQKAGIEIEPQNTEELKAAILTFSSMNLNDYKLWQIGALNCANKYIESNQFDEIYKALTHNQHKKY